jgi:phosphotransacetylase
VEILERCKKACHRHPGVVVFPDCLDQRVLDAAGQLKSEGLVEPVLMASPFSVRSKMHETRMTGMGLTVVDPASHGFLEKNSRDYMALQKAKGKSVTAKATREAMRSPLAAAAMMVRRGEAEIGIGGNLSSTATVLRAGLSVLPRKPGIKTISSFFLMVSPDGEKQYIFADCAVVPEPSADTLADIAVASADKAMILLDQAPRIAMLSFSTKGSAVHQRTKMVSDAVTQIRTRDPELLVDGELQLDAAVVPRVAALKAPGSFIEGKANVLIFPSLEAGNIGYKLVQRLAGYTAIGPFIQGFDGGWHDLSRGCSADDIYKVAVIGICLKRGSPTRHGTRFADEHRIVTGSFKEVEQ